MKTTAKSSYNSYEISVLINNRAIPEYKSPNNGLTYVEGRNGSEYDIQLRNLSSDTVLFVPSVDGLSITDGKVASDSSGGYVLRPYQTVIVPGWTLNNNAVAKFKFNDVKSSYTVQAGNGPSNVGVIGCLVYKQKYKPAYTIPVPTWRFGDTYYSKSTYAADSYNPLRGMLMNTSEPVIGASLNCNYIAPQTATASAVAPSVGTEFGKETSFNTSDTTFDRLDYADCLIEIFYDSRKNLEKLGIVFPQVVVSNPRPNSFPAMKAGCTPPKNWNL